MPVVFWLSYGALWVLVVFQSLVLLGLVRTTHGARSAHAHAGSDSGKEGADLLHERAPSFSALDLSGERFDSGELAGRAWAALFVSPRCRSCTVTLDELESLTWKANGEVVVICRGGARECERLVEAHRLSARVVVDDTFEISRAYKVRGVPTAVLVDERQVVQSYGNPMRDEELVEVVDDELAVAIEEVS
jgi:peroxiredoxin